MPTELECKLSIDSIEAVAESLLRLGAIKEKEVYEKNWILDTPTDELRTKMMLLRIRFHESESGCVVTMKKPSEASRFKNRIEIETHADNAENAMAIFAGLGYRPKWYYEKKRQYWRLDDFHIALDKMPEIGCYIEIEGPDEYGITALINRLGLDPEKHIQLNYLGIFAEHCRKRGTPLRDMKF